MTFFVVMILLFFAVIGLVAGLLYYLPRRIPNAKKSKLVSRILGLLLLAFLISIVFEDQLFTKGNARSLVEEQQIILSDRIQLVHNASMWSPGDYYHTFTLMISQRDKENAIFQIRNAEKFIDFDGSNQDYFYQQLDSYHGPKVIRNYETADSYVREYFEPSGKEGYAPTFRRISISKSGNELIFEDIDD